MKNITKAQWLNIVFIISTGGLLSGLIAFAYMGSFIRLIGDDYFLAANLKAYGFWGAQVHAYINHVYFHGNRFSQTFILTVFSLFPPKISGMIPLLTIIALVGAIYAFISTLLSHFSLQFQKLIRLNLSLIISFFSLYLAPTINQGLYWRSSMVSSFGTHIGAFLLGALILWKKPMKWFWFPLIFVYALFNAGLSENGSAYQGMLLGMLLLFALYLKEKGSAHFSRIVYLSTIALIGTIGAVIILWKSPGISIFKRDISSSFMESIILSYYHMVNFYKEVILSRTLDIAILVLLGFMIYYLINHALKDHLPQKPYRPMFWVLQMIIVQIVNLILIFAIMIPSAYTRNAYPDPRHFMGAVLVFMFAYLMTGFYCGAFLQALIPASKVLFEKRAFFIGLLFFGMLALAYPLAAIPRITAEHLRFKYWAMQWDNRHTIIVRAAQAGEQEVHVIQLDHIIENVMELGPDPTSPTYNEPASIYYGITIIADLPGWDEGFIAFRDKQK
jgi:hypothetical protein